MPELPDVTVYVEALERRITGHRLEDIRLSSPFVLRTVAPPLAEANGKRVVGVRRLGKRIVIALESEIFLVLHLMIAGRLRWLLPGAKPPARITLATFAFDDGALAFTEAGTRSAPRCTSPRARLRWRSLTGAASSSTTSMPPPSRRA